MQKKTIWEMGRPTVDEFRRSEKLPLAVVLDNVRSLNNIGSIFRTSDAFRVGRLVLCGITATPPSPEIHKTALGAEDSVDWCHYESTAEAVSALMAEGTALIALCVAAVLALELVNGSVPLDRYETVPGGKYAIVAGHEVDGVSQDVVDMCDACIEIPQEGTKHSLNVAVSTAIALWHFYLRLR